jgi:hypothetical protein
MIVDRAAAKITLQRAMRGRDTIRAFSPSLALITPARCFERGKVVIGLY